jgi:hypothetical protein
MKFERFIVRYGWLIVMSASLSISAWSLYFVGVHYGILPILAALISAVLDLGAITCAVLALAYARTHADSGLAPRIGVLALGGISALLNMQHATLAGNDFLAAKILYATPPIVAVFIFELQTRWLRRGALRRAGRIPERIPVVGRAALFLFPVRSVKVIRNIVAYRLDQIETRGTGQLTASTSTETESVSYQVSTTVVRQWAKSRGMEVGAKGPIKPEIRASYLAELEGMQPGKHEYLTSMTRENTVQPAVQPGSAPVPLGLPRVPATIENVSPSSDNSGDSSANTDENSRRD